MTMKIEEMEEYIKLRDERDKLTEQVAGLTGVNADLTAANGGLTEDITKLRKIVATYVIAADTSADKTKNDEPKTLRELFEAEGERLKTKDGR